ncbi:MAG: bifunctional folylpolyglutamate synthase/dihydrofolate synthase [Bacilli bacterium]|nr:bifunctional folylpolyglutamate synthase/dihydrofolate synthase [Bacilli bacterium]
MPNTYPFNDITSCINWIESQRRFSKKTSLDNMKHYCKLLGNPQDKFTSIHVTGTNGKGSVVSYLKNIFLDAHINVGTFTSPYIIKFNERICYNGEMISDEEVLKLAKKVYDIYSQLELDNISYPSFFEFTTLMAFVYFSEKENLDVVIVEVGIGGTLDSTNVITPIASIITNVSYDHMNVLGNTLEEILANKLGIVKTNVPAIMGIKDENLIEVAKKHLETVTTEGYFPLTKSPVIHYSNINGSSFDYQGFKDLQITLSGYHQIENAIIALETIKTLKNKFNITTDNIYQGLLNTKWLGRMEILSNQPLIVVDGAHNIDGITRIAEFVKNLKYTKKRCIFSCSDDKEKEKMIAEIEPYFDEIILTAFTYKRHSDASELYEYSQHQNKRINLDIDSIIDEVFENPYDFNIFIGSLYFVSEVRPKILNRKHNPN